MNLLEKAMRQKSQRTPQTDPKTELPATDTPQGGTGTNVRTLWISAGITAALAIVATGMQSVSTSNQDSPDAKATSGYTTAQERDPSSDVAATVTGWAAAWSAKNIDQYLSAYAPDFRPQGNLSHAAWLKQRRHRLSRYSTIEVRVSDLSITIEDDAAVAKFSQDFRGDRYSETGLHKQLELRRKDGRWLIVRETS